MGRPYDADKYFNGLVEERKTFLMQEIYVHGKDKAIYITPASATTNALVCDQLSR